MPQAITNLERKSKIILMVSAIRSVRVLVLMSSWGSMKQQDSKLQSKLLILGPSRAIPLLAQCSMARSMLSKNSIISTY